MQTVNVNPPVTVIGRHIDVTDAIKDFAEKKIEGLHLDYPRIMEARVILDVEKSRRQMCEIVLFCANHITIQAKTTNDDLYSAIDETISKIARRMRKHKTRLLKRSRPRNVSIRHITEQVYHADILGGSEMEAVFNGAALPVIDHEHEHEPDLEPSRIHEEAYQVRPLFRDEAMLEIEMTDAQFIVFTNAATGKLSIIYRRNDGDFGLIEPGNSH